MANNQPLVVEGRVVKVDWKTASEETLVAQGVPETKVESKLITLQAGGEKAERTPVFPTNRACQDGLWIVFFFLFGLALVAYGVICLPQATKKAESLSTSTESDIKSDDIELPSLIHFVAMVLASLATAVVSSLGFIKLAHLQPACVVWTALIGGPVMGIAIGLAMAGAGAASGNIGLILIGGVVTFVSTCSLGCTLYWASRYAPFMIKLTEVVSDVIEDHPCCIGVGLLGSFIAFLWMVAMAFAFGSILLANPELMAKGNNAGRYGMTFLLALSLAWGGQVADNICHVTYCGVFGRWYFGGQDGSDSDVEGVAVSLGKGTPNTLGPSLTVALTTSLGSICCGSLLVAVIRGVEQVAYQMQLDAASNGNIIGCIVAAILKCFISCIGDIIEYFNDWAYVQCAIRGVSFFDAATITLTMLTCANLKYIIADLLLNSLVSCGALLVASVCALVAAGLGFALGGALTAAYGAVTGLFIGAISGSAALGVINSGVKTILACWAEDSTPLSQTHPEIHDEFVTRIREGMGAAEQSE